MDLFGVKNFKFYILFLFFFGCAALNPLAAGECANCTQPTNTQASSGEIGKTIKDDRKAYVRMKFIFSMNNYFSGQTTMASPLVLVRVEHISLIKDTKKSFGEPPRVFDKLGEPFYSPKVSILKTGDNFKFMVNGVEKASKNVKFKPWGNNPNSLFEVSASLAESTIVEEMVKTNNLIPVVGGVAGLSIKSFDPPHQSAFITCSLENGIVGGNLLGCALWQGYIVNI